MEREDAHPLPACDPIVGGPLVITELTGVESGVTIRGRFTVPRFARLNPEQARYLETFLRCRGMLNSVEKELGISYPTARARLDAVLKALDLHAVREDAGPSTNAGAAHPEEALDVAPSPYESDETSWQPAESEKDGELTEPIASNESAIQDEPEPAEPETPQRSRDEILSMLERGEISVDDVKKELERAR